MFLDPRLNTRIPEASAHMSRLPEFSLCVLTKTFFHYCSFNEPNCVDISLFSRSSLPPSPQEMLMLEIHYTSVYILWSFEKAAKYTVSEISHLPKTNITPIRSNIARFNL